MAEGYHYYTEPRELWQLEFHADRVQQAALGWQWLAENLRTRMDRLAASDRRLLEASWSGEAREAFDEHRRRLTNTMEGAAEEADLLCGALQDLAGQATDRQGRLNQNLYQLLRYEKADESTPATLVFRVPEEAKADVDTLVEEAYGLRKGFDEVLDSAQFSADGVWADLSHPWEGVANGTADPFLVPDESSTTWVLDVDGTTIVNTGSGDDNVRVIRDPETGLVQVIVNGTVHLVDGPLIIRTGPGTNTVEVGADVPVRLVLGGEDADTIRVASPGTAVVTLGGDDRVFGALGRPANERDNYISLGGGHDYAEGRGGNDLILGGMGGDTIYGGTGRDDLLPGEGANYTDGGADADRIFSRADDQSDLDAGGPGEDLRTGGVGWEYHDRDDEMDPASLAVGSAPDGSETNTVYIATDPPRELDLSFIKIEGSPEFVARVQDDLHTLSRTYGSDRPELNEGSFRLGDLEQNRDGNFLPGGHSLTIREAPDATATTTTESDTGISGNRDTVIYYNPVRNGPLDDPDNYHHDPGAPAAHLMRELGNEAVEW